MADKAVLIGINTYKDAPLNGCLDDIHDMANQLVDRYKFRADNVRLLANDRANTNNIKNRLWWLIDVGPGDRCFFHFSGHGTQFPTRDRRQELDGLLEVICPYDFNWTPQKMISDKTFFQIFGKIPPGVKFNWVSDSCHSGDLSRDISENTQNPRFYPQPIDIAWRLRGIKQRNIQVSDRAIINNRLDVGFISGCRSNQTSADTIINGRWNGALTYFLIKNLKRLPLDTPLTKVVAAVNADLQKNGYSQRPQVEGVRANKPFLG